MYAGEQKTVRAKWFLIAYVRMSNYNLKNILNENYNCKMDRRFGPIQRRGKNCEGKVVLDQLIETKTFKKHEP
jgi:hypothetical protein